MQAGDVIVRVNNEWIHEDNNVLFQTLSNDKNVDISIMRNGFPVHFSFNITE
jgi:type II secretory pathway component PulC